MIRIGICDDEACMCSRIKDLAVSFLNRNNRDAEFFLFGSGEAVLECREKLDILFLDIQMDNMDGMETAKKLRNGQFQGFMNCKKLANVQLKGKALKSIKAGAFKKTSAKLKVSAKKMSKKEKAKLLKALKKAGCSKKVKVK